MAQYELVSAGAEDLSVCMAILDSGRDFQRAQGFTQWRDGYPAAKDVLCDIQQKGAYLLMADNTPAAYIFIGFAGDPSYPAIEGRWHHDAPYAVFHRVAISGDFRGMGLADILLHRAGALAHLRGFHVLRIDTHEDNKRMQHVLTKNGFSYCGTVLQNGEPRLAYDKKL